VTLLTVTLCYGVVWVAELVVGGAGGGVVWCGFGAGALVCSGTSVARKGQKIRSPLTCAKRRSRWTANWSKSSPIAMHRNFIADA